MSKVDALEIHYGLVAQYLGQLPPKLQALLVAQAGSYTALFTKPPDTFEAQLHQTVSRLQYDYHQRHWSGRVEASIALAEQVGAQIIPITSADYPPLLKQISRAPPLLYCRGDINNLHLPQIAIVGSRRMTRGGEINARQWSKFLASHGFTITSGLALGVDGCAHQGALDAPKGKTVAVMATGIERIYPQRHGELAAHILESGGTLVSEFHPNEKPLPANFPRRNRIISGLSLAVLVIEAAVKSGSLITARCALEQNREVFAIPGSIHNPHSRGCHLLIKEGAHLVETAKDIVGELGGALAGVASGTQDGLPLAPLLDKQESALLEILGFEPVALDRLSQETQLPAQTLSQLLISLELKGIVCSENGFYQRLPESQG